MYCSYQQIRLTRFFSFFNAKTGYGRLDQCFLNFFGFVHP